ncbi:YceI family protein [Kitasatospora aureofaciens]|uniref:Polyisoprenoid-binding protein n=1 Tax=Kitasatospora aureofaciens TaxID=1894 RepID=A0A1E7NBN6_KITAU|nr:YceI family protein [Kitasatospora aureofaciens]OEV38068.1 polyisoprenoid-binding protein [Kitasatospora aureofaciens]QEV00948.1 polyisoprenoid-binding protein [Streptomyces viridifaciens]UKZ07274.1 YceI family protein [Streptomyces viridifaciens]GGU87417.1 polyisoprenoid-binding protein [Kitasatospora aureofaciens]
MGLFNRTKTATTATVQAPAGPDLSHLTGDWTVDAMHSEIGFSVRHAMVTNVKGRFTEYDGKLHLDGATPGNSSADLVIKVASIDTNQAQRDEHLRTGDFFAAETYPEIRFRSISTEAVGEDSYRMNGELTIKDTTRPVVLDLEYTGSATDAYGAERVGFEGKAVVDRTDFGLTYNAALETGGVLIGEKVKLSFDISAVKAA